MKFTSKGNKGMEVEFEETDTDSEKRILEQGLAFIRNTLQRMREVEANRKS